MASKYNLPHYIITGQRSEDRYTSHNNPRTEKEFDREAHSRRLIAELEKGVASFQERQPENSLIGTPDGVFLEVTLSAGTEVTSVLQKNRMQVGATKMGQNGERTVGLFVPKDSLPILHSILEDYGYGPRSKSGNPPNKQRVEAIARIREANFLSFWNDDRFRLPEDEHTAVWWEVWCSPDHEDDLDEMCERLGLTIGARERRMRFHDSTIVPVFATKLNIELVLFARFSIQELRRSDDTPAFYLEDNDADEQLAWIDSLAQNITWPDEAAPHISILDTGVNRAHDLIEPALAPTDLFAVDDRGGFDDTGHVGLRSHGTQMASLALHGDLTWLLSTTAPVRLIHRVESVKIIPPHGRPPNPEDKLGRLTELAVLDPEAKVPDRKRIYCLAVSNKDRAGNQPSPWSAAIDRLAAGALNSDDETEPKRLFLVSSGNTDGGIVHFDERRTPVDSPVLDPAQSWNALRVGGVTEKDVIKGPGAEDLKVLVTPGDLSPHSRTSLDWDDSRTPFKPEVVFEAGNKVVDQDGYVMQTNSLDLLAAGRDMGQEPLKAFRATSAATALAARNAAQICARYPDFWPETIRALIVHSAEWTDLMKAEFASIGDNKSRAKQLLRTYGYGVPDIDRACASATNHVVLIAEETIKPFIEGSMGQSHTFNLPWPRAAIEDLGDKLVSVKVTLSYFIEPNPGRTASIYPSRYQSFGLRFDLRRVGESRREFLKQTNKRQLDGEKKFQREVDEGWQFGSNAVSAGSLHCDVWTGQAAKLLTRDMLAIYPVTGWWKHSKDPKFKSKACRYSLIVSIKSDDTKIDLHTPIGTPVNLEQSISSDNIIDLFS